MKKDNNKYIDLSDIKDDELDKTGSFTDLMSRTEKKEHERMKEEEKTRELKEILMNDDDKKEIKQENKRKKQKERIIAKEEKRLEKEAIKDIQKELKDNSLNKAKDLASLDKTQKFLDLTNEIKLSMLNNVNDNIKDTKQKKFGIGNIIVTDVLIIISLAYYIYSILFTNVQTSQLYLLIGGLIILCMIMFFCISIISNRTISKIFSILNYLIFIGYVLFNLILVIGIITLWLFFYWQTKKRQFQLPFFSNLSNQYKHK